MDILAPDLMWIDGRCYRVPILDSAFSSIDIDTLRDCELEGEADEMIQCEDEDLTDLPDIELLQNGRYRMVYPVSRSFLPFIIGSKGATIKRISKDTSCNIITPKFSEEQNITITGQCMKKVILAWKSIAFVMKSCRQKLAVTHFIGIPLTGKDIQENFKKFKEDVLLTCNGRGINENIFQDPKKLHITAVVLILADDKERKLAKEKFLEVCNQQIKEVINDNKPCILEVRGLEYFNDDPSDVNLLYANVYIKDRENLLQDICNKIYHAFKDYEFMKNNKTDIIKIHLTLMNTNFSYNDSELQDCVNKKSKSNISKKETFDATEILTKYNDFYFGEQELKCVHLSIRSTVDKDGYYKHAAMVEF